MCIRFLSLFLWIMLLRIFYLFILPKLYLWEHKLVQTAFNPFLSSVTFLYLLKTSENQRFSDVFKLYRNVKYDAGLKWVKNMWLIFDYTNTKNLYYEDSDVKQILHLQIIKNEWNMHHCAADMLVLTFCLIWESFKSSNWR